MPAPARVRVVVVSWNGAHLLPACLDSVLGQTVRDRLEVVVVDNASQDGTEAMLRDRYPEVTVLQTGRNLGFAGGADVALRTATDAEHVVLLNNDARFAPDAVERLLAAADDPAAHDVGAFTCKILLSSPAADGRPLVNSTGNVVDRWGAGQDRDWLVPAGAESDDPDVFGFCGGAALLRVSALDEVGGFDPDLFLYYEDTDLSWRLRAAGWRVRYVADAVAVHDHAASSGTGSPVFRFHNTRNSLLVAGRHAPLGVVLGSFARQSVGLVLAAVRQGPTHPLVRARARGLAAFLGRLPRTLGERRRTWRGARVPRRTVWALARASDRDGRPAPDPDRAARAGA